MFFGLYSFELQLRPLNKIVPGAQRYDAQTTMTWTKQQALPFMVSGEWSKSTVNRSDSATLTKRMFWLGGLGNLGFGWSKLA